MSKLVSDHELTYLIDKGCIKVSFGTRDGFVDIEIDTEDKELEVLSRNLFPLETWEEGVRLTALLLVDHVKSLIGRTADAIGDAWLTEVDDELNKLQS